MKRFAAMLLGTLLLFLFASCAAEPLAGSGPVSFVPLDASVDGGPFIVTFDAAGGSAVEAQQVEANEKADRPEDPRREHYVFTGWTCEGQAWSFEERAVTRNVTLTANWAVDYDGAVRISHDGEITGADDFIRTLRVIEIPEVIGDFRVVSIGNDAFYGCVGLTSVTLPRSVQRIGGGAFGGCTSLTEIVIPNGVREIAVSAFGGCTALERITVEEGNPVYHGTDNCVIETAAGQLLFGCSGSAIPADGSVTSIAEGAFASCAGLSGVTIPDCVTSIGSGAFNTCTGLTSVVIPDGVTCIDRFTFAGCTGLTSVGIGRGVQIIDEYAFAFCSHLTNVVIPQGVSRINGAAFSECVGLASITIPASVTSFGYEAFYGCADLLDITYGGTMEEWNAIGKWHAWDSGTGAYTVHCTDGDIVKTET